MRLLLDTHFILWWQADHPRLSTTVREMIEQASEVVFVSRASLWEIAIKANQGKLRLNLAEFVCKVEENGFQWLDIRNEHLLVVASLPLFDDHKDPFDRLLVAQSLTESLILLTTDAKLARYGATVRVM